MSNGKFWAVLPPLLPPSAFPSIDTTGNNAVLDRSKFSFLLTTMGTQERILNSNCRCSLSLSNICSWWLLLSEHNRQSSAKPRSSFIAIVASRDAECKRDTHERYTHKRTITERLGYAALAARICRVSEQWTRKYDAIGCETVWIQITASTSLRRNYLQEKLWKPIKSNVVNSASLLMEQFGKTLLALSIILSSLIVIRKTRIEWHK